MTGPLAQQFARLREALDFLADDSLETTIERIIETREWSEKQAVSSQFLIIVDALSSIERHVQDMTERLDDFGHSLSNWESAYPTSVFGDDLTSEEQRAVTDAIVGAGFTSDRVHASWGRHIVRCFTEAFAPVRAALPAREKGEPTDG